MHGRAAWLVGAKPLEPLKAVAAARPPTLCAAIDSDYESAFIPFDTDKGGYAAGSLPVTLELVAC